VFLQGHPEYEPSTLGREYRRDVGRYLRRERDTYPSQPQRYYDAATSRALDAFRARAMGDRSEVMLQTFPATSMRTQLMDSARASAVRLYRNWLSCIEMRRGKPNSRKLARAAVEPVVELGHIPNSAASV
jgi:homoserine O-succinyltransferase